MKPTTKYLDHSYEEMEIISEKIELFSKIFDEAAEFLVLALLSNKEQEKSEPSNVFHIAPQVKVDLYKVYKEEKTIFEIVLIFEPWYKELDRLNKQNKDHIGRKVLIKHISQVCQICALFQKSHVHAT